MPPKKSSGAYYPAAAAAAAAKFPVMDSRAVGLIDKPEPSTQTIRYDDERSVLYLVHLIFPSGFFPLFLTHGGGAEHRRRLGATKIGKAMDWARFHGKLARLKTHISFARLAWTAILHNHDSLEVEQAMHFVYRRFHVEGEWYDMNAHRKNELRERFPNCQIVSGETQFPELQPVIGPEGPGFAYLASYDWPEAVRTAIVAVFDAAPTTEIKFVCQQMLCMKIGSTGDLAERGHKFNWACCFARIRYTAIHRIAMRQEEQVLHNTWQYRHSGVGEWFCLASADIDAILSNYPPADVTNGFWEREGLTEYVYNNLQYWCDMGWVKPVEIGINYASGHFITTSGALNIDDEWTTEVP